jgi:NDP-sugar pyrophosphorylase family protein
MLSQAVILAGGRGDRLRPLTDSIPKPMAPINGNPFMDYLIYSIVKAGIKEIIILLGYKGDIIFDRYKAMRDITIKFSFGSDDELTGRRVLNAYDHLDDHFLLMYGDNYWPIELSRIEKNYQHLNVGVTTTVFSNTKGTGEYGFDNNVEVGENGIVIDYDKARATDCANGVDIGYFLVKKDCLDYKTSGNVSFELDILPQLITRGQLGAYITNSQYYYITDIHTLKDFEFASITNKFLPLPESHWGLN